MAKTVNQDDPSVYHLFYGDEEAHPGADLTFFEYRLAKPGRAGAGMIHRIVHRVGSPESLAYWADRLRAEGTTVERDENSVRFADPETLAHELVVDTSGDPPLTAAHPEIPPEHALRGFEGVRAYSAAPDRSAALLERVLGAKPTDDASTRSTSASPAASSTSWPRRSPASSSTACPSRSSAAGSSCRRSSRTVARRSRRA